MSVTVDNTVEVDLHRLQLRFAETRLSEPGAIEKLARSIEQCGQVMPCIVVPNGESSNQLESYVLIKGYRRVAALRRLGRDTVQIQVWRCAVSDGLLQMLARAHAHPHDPIEEALLLRELVDGQGLTQNEIARRSGRDVSWVNRRLGLLTGMPQQCLSAVREGTISCWAATRVLAPLARANAEHASALVKAAVDKSISTRDLAQWYAHYQKSTRAVRERMAGDPGLFLRAKQARQQELETEALRKGPEGKCLKDLHAVDAIVARVRQRLTELSGQELPPELLEMLQRLRARLVSWCEDLRRLEDDRSTDTQCGDNSTPSELGAAPHCTGDETLPEHRQTHSAPDARE